VIASRCAKGCCIARFGEPCAPLSSRRLRRLDSVTEAHDATLERLRQSRKAKLVNRSAKTAVSVEPMTMIGQRS
jgi:hypothetical protein